MMLWKKKYSTTTRGVLKNVSNIYDEEILWK